MRARLRERGSRLIDVDGLPAPKSIRYKSGRFTGGFLIYTETKEPDDPFLEVSLTKEEATDLIERMMLQ